MTSRRQMPAAPLPGSPTPPATTCLWPAPSTPPRSPTRSPACWASTMPSSIGWRCRQRPVRSGLTLLPYFDGERTPNLPKATGLLAGLRSDVTRAELARAAVEGVVCGLLDALDALAAHAAISSVRLVGGGARSAAYRHVITELCDLPVSVADADRSGCHGCVRAGRGGGRRHRPRGGGRNVGASAPAPRSGNPAATRPASAPGTRTCDRRRTRRLHERPVRRSRRRAGRDASKRFAWPAVGWPRSSIPITEAMRRGWARSTSRSKRWLPS